MTDASNPTTENPTTEEETNIQEFMTMCLDILKDSTLDLCTMAYQKIVDKEIDSQLDMLLRTIGGIQPFQLIIPDLREALGFAITNDDSCVQQLTLIKEHISNTKSLDATIKFIQTGDLEEDVVPEVDLLILGDEIPEELIPSLLNCIDYVRDISEFPDQDQKDQKKDQKME